MNLALSALLIILFLLPAFTFRIGISLPLPKTSGATHSTDDMISRNASRLLAKLNFTETVFLFSIVPIVLHLVSLLVIYSFTPIDYSLLLNIFAGKPNVLQGSSNDSFHPQLLSFLLYTLIEGGIAGVAGWWLMQRFSDKPWLSELLMGNNPWFRLFTGMALTEDQKKQLSAILVEVLVETKENSVIYSGLLKNYDVSDGGNKLAYITLTGAFRRDLRKAQISSKELESATIVSSTRYHNDYGDVIAMPGSIFTISGEKIANVNITYMKQVQQSSTQQSALLPII